MAAAYEVNFDGIVGPTHNYSGLSYGNLASERHRLIVSHPRQAALQGLAKMKFMMELGVKQALLPPQERPLLSQVRKLGFSGSDAQVLAKAYREDRVLLAACSSASSMWAANAATVSPSSDAMDSKVHFTPANLISHFHRSLETAQTARVLRRIFSDEKMFVHHDPLPAAMQFSDEGAANHARLCAAHARSGVAMFVYGREAFAAQGARTRKYPARQSLEASRTVARRHRLREDRVVFVKQSAAAIDAGVFHNDVVAVGNEDVFFYHESAYEDSQRVIKELGKTFQRICGKKLRLIRVDERTIPLKDAIESYLFNSQLITIKRGMALVAPLEARENAKVRKYLDRLVNRSDAISAVHYVEVRQSMQNGGGPACLRLRVVLTEGQMNRAHPGVFLSDALYERLTQWVVRHYREDLRGEDLADPDLLRESHAALDELTRILKLDSLYEFQRA